jgi:hypothetical protein
MHLSQRPIFRSQLRSVGRSRREGGRRHKRREGGRRHKRRAASLSAYRRIFSRAAAYLTIIKRI